MRILDDTRISDEVHINQPEVGSPIMRMDESDSPALQALDNSGRPVQYASLRDSDENMPEMVESIVMDENQPRGGPGSFGDIWSSLRTTLPPPTDHTQVFVEEMIQEEQCLRLWWFPPHEDDKPSDPPNDDEMPELLDYYGNVVPDTETHVSERAVGGMTVRWSVPSMLVFGTKMIAGRIIPYDEPKNLSHDENILKHNSTFLNMVHEGVATRVIEAGSQLSKAIFMAVNKWIESECPKYQNMHQTLSILEDQVGLRFWKIVRGEREFYLMYVGPVAKVPRHMSLIQ